LFFLVFFFNFWQSSRATADCDNLRTPSDPWLEGFMSCVVYLRSKPSDLDSTELIEFCGTAKISPALRSDDMSGEWSLAATYRPPTVP
jgi:hypothetical protein